MWQGLYSSSHSCPGSKPPSCPEVYSAASSEALTLVDAVGVGQQLCFFLPEQLSQSLPLPTLKQQLFQIFCLKCKSSLFQKGSLRLEQTSALPQTWACFCLPGMPESAWQGCVCLQSGTVPWLPGETCSLSGHYPQQGVASSLFAMPDANAWFFCCKISPKFLVSSCVFSHPCPLILMDSG